MLVGAFKVHSQNCRLLYFTNTISKHPRYHSHFSCHFMSSFLIFKDGQTAIAAQGQVIAIHRGPLNQLWGGTNALVLFEPYKYHKQFFGQSGGAS